MADITGFERQRRIEKEKKEKAEKENKKPEMDLDQPLAKMRKDELEAYCLKKYGADLDMRKKKSDLIAEINELEAEQLKKLEAESKTEGFEEIKTNGFGDSDE